MAGGRIRRPFWLTRPTRFARLGRDQARIGLIGLALLMMVCLTALGATVGDGEPIGSAGAALNLSIVEGLRHGGAFYAAAAEALHGGLQRPSPLAFPMPLLATIEAFLPGMLTVLLLYAVIAAAVLAWFVRLRPSFQRGARLVPPMLAAIGVSTALRGGLVALPEVWAGALITLSLAMARPGRWIDAVTLALLAMLIAPAAAIYAMVMALFAAIEGRRAELCGWAVALIAFAIAFYCHLDAAAQIENTMGFGDIGAGLLGLGIVINATVGATALAILPMLLGALLVGLAVAGWVAWDDPAGLRAAVIVITYAAVIGIVADDGAIDRVMLVTPLLLVGLAFAPDAVGDLVHRAVDRRRITVTRIER